MVQVERGYLLGRCPGPCWHPVVHDREPARLDLLREEQAEERLRRVVVMAARMEGWALEAGVAGVTGLCSCVVGGM